MSNNANPTTEECPVVKHKIGQTTYIVKVRFSETGETMSDKIKRLLRNEVIKM